MRSVLFICASMLVMDCALAEDEKISKNIQNDLTKEEVEQLKEMFGEHWEPIGYRGAENVDAWLYGPPMTSYRGYCFRPVVGTGGKIDEHGQVQWIRFAPPYDKNGNYFENRHQVVWLHPDHGKGDCQQLNLKTATRLTTVVEEAALIRLSEELPQLLHDGKKMLDSNEQKRFPRDVSSYYLNSVEIGRLSSKGNYAISAADRINSKNQIYDMVIETGKDGSFVVTSMGEIHY